MTSGTLSRFLPFSGIGFGLGIGVGCGVGCGTGTGNQVLKVGNRIRGFGLGGGCGVGFGFGWGIFLFAVGTPFKRTEDIFRRPDRMLDRAAKKLQEDRDAGIIPPFGAGMPNELRTNDPLLDRLIRGILIRRARMRESRLNQGAPLHE